MPSSIEWLICIRLRTYKTNLKGISTTSLEFNFISGYIFLYNLDDIVNATETSNMEQNIHIHTN